MKTKKNIYIYNQPINLPRRNEMSINFTAHGPMTGSADSFESAATENHSFYCINDITLETVIEIEIERERGGRREGRREREIYAALTLRLLKSSAVKAAGRWLN